MIKFRGIPAAPGIADGPAYRFTQAELQVTQRQVANPAAEWERLQGALATARTQLAELQAKITAEASAEEAAIFEAHAMFLDDPALLDTVQSAIETERQNAEAAWYAATEGYAAQMEAMDNEYLRARAADIRDVGRRVVQILAGETADAAAGLRTPSIIVARDLTPSDTAGLNKALVLGFATAEGGPTSHTAILAKALALPAVVGLGAALLDLPAGTPLIVDGQQGELVADPDEATAAAYREAGQKAAQQAEIERAAAGEPAVTLDGVRLEVVANAGNAEDAASALAYGAEGIGLLRTEFLYLDRRTAPDEEEQYAAYKAVFDVMGQRPVVVRTLDVGGDKELPYLDLGDEANPFLGWRAIRMCLDNPDFFKIQLRALLRAGRGHDLRIMFPMIATVDEVRRSKALLDEARAEALAAGHQPAENVQVGIMVEIPAVAILADRFTPVVDFFSIGTNDLTQYTMAAERTNDKVAHLNDPCHPAVLRQIQTVIQASHAADIWTGVCGEMGGDPDAVPILLGLGLDEFSMAPAAVPHAKAILRRWSRAAAAQLAEQALALDSAEAVRALVRATPAR